MKYFNLIVTLLLSYCAFGQQKLPIIKASSNKVAIRDGENFSKNAWTLDASAKPDVYTCERTRDTKWVVFYTDIDSIKVKVKPGTVSNFIILLNGKDSCFTQIKSAIPMEEKNSISSYKPDTIHFTLSPYNAIWVKSVFNDRDTLSLHFDVGSFDFRLTKDAILNKTKLLANQPDALAGKSAPNYNNLEIVYKIQMGTLVFNNPVVLATGFTSQNMDGRFGWNIFEGKVVEIDYEKSILVIYSKMPKKKNDFVKSKIEFTHDFVCINGDFEIKNKKYSGKFIMDTGSDQAIILDSVWVSKQKFPTDLKLIKSSSLKDPRGVVYENKIVLAPLFTINSFKVSNIPTCLLGSNNPVRFEVNYLGNDLLKRFNTIIDFKHDYIYLKPNSLMNEPFRDAG